jgi:predicted deacylase
MSLHEIGQPESRTFGSLRFDHPALAGIEWPYVSIRGRGDGPTIGVTGGMHGSEYTGIEAVLRIAQAVTPQDVTGHLLMIPVVNRPAFWAHVAHVVPLDGKNPSRTYPGRRDGTVSEAMAAHLFDEVFSHCDALIDLHSGDIMERLTPFTIYQGGPDKALEERGRLLAASFGFPVSVRRPDEVLTRPVPGYLAAAATLRGIPAIVAEAGGEGTLREDDVSRHMTGLRAALVHLGVLRGSAVPPAQPRIVEFAFVFAPEDGVFSWQVDVGDRLHTGQRLGVLRDAWGRTVTELTAPADGELLFFSTSLAARTGDLLFGMGVPLSR